MIFLVKYEISLQNVNCWGEGALNRTVPFRATLNSKFDDSLIKGVKTIILLMHSLEN